MSKVWHDDLPATDQPASLLTLFMFRFYSPVVKAKSPIGTALAEGALTFSKQEEKASKSPSSNSAPRKLNAATSGTPQIPSPPLVQEFKPGHRRIPTVSRTFLRFSQRFPAAKYRLRIGYPQRTVCRTARERRRRGLRCSRGGFGGRKVLRRPQNRESSSASSGRRAFPQAANLYDYPLHLVYSSSLRADSRRSAGIAEDSDDEDEENLADVDEPTITIGMVPRSGRPSNIVPLGTKTAKEASLKERQNPFVSSELLSGQMPTLTIATFFTVQHLLSKLRHPKSNA